MYETLELEIKEGVAQLTLNRPRVLNAINREMMGELKQVCEELDENEKVGVVVLRGAGRAFCAGADMKWSEEMTPKDRVESNRIGQRAFARIASMMKPIFAAVHGYALGGGLELALAADFIVCSDDAKLGLPEITLSAKPPYRPKITEEGDPDQPEFGGAGPGWGGIKRLPERIGKARAKELMLTGVHVDSSRALTLGLVNDVYPSGEFDERVTELARRIAAMNHYNVRLIKELVDHGYDLLELHPR